MRNKFLLLISCHVCRSVARARDAKAAGSGGSEKNRFSYSPRTESKGREMSDGATRKGFISARPTLGRWWAGRSKTSLKCQEYGFIEGKCGAKVGIVHAV